MKRLGFLKRLFVAPFVGKAVLTTTEESSPCLRCFGREHVEYTDLELERVDLSVFTRPSPDYLPVVTDPRYYGPCPSCREGDFLSAFPGRRAPKPITASEHHEAYTHFTSRGVIEVPHDFTIDQADAFKKWVERQQKFVMNRFREEQGRILRGITE